MDAARSCPNAHAFARATRDLPDLLDLIRLAVWQEYADAGGHSRRRARSASTGASHFQQTWCEERA
jgi:hypothetical protein